MTKQQIELSQLIAYEIGVAGETFNWCVIVDTLNILYRNYTRKDLQLMIIDSHTQFCGINETIKLILTDTYSTQLS